MWNATSLKSDGERGTVFLDLKLQKSVIMNTSCECPQIDSKV